MPRYIDADKLLEQLKKKKPENAKQRYTEGFNDAIMRVRSMVHSSFTADVVPRAEVDELKKERDEYKKHVDEDIIYVHRIKAEVTREIFEEIIKILNNEFRKCEKDEVQIVLKISRPILELKKKYTEEKQ